MKINHDEPMEFKDLSSMTYQPSLQENNAPKKKKPEIDTSQIKLIIFLLIAILAVILVIFGAIKLIKDKSYKGVAKEYLKSNCDYILGDRINLKKMSKHYPDFMDDILDDYYDRMEEYAEEMDDELDRLKDELDVDLDSLTWSDLCTLSFQIVDQKELDEDDLEDYEDQIREVADHEHVKLEAGYHIKVKPELKLKWKAKLAKKTLESLDDLDIGYDIDEIDDLYDLFDEAVDEYTGNGKIDLIVLKCNGKTGVWLMEDYYIWDGLEVWYKAFYY